MHEDQIRAKKVCNLFKFIDDRNVINDGGKFENNFRGIYLEELQLSEENSKSRHHFQFTN